MNNLLAQALPVIGNTKVNYFKFKERTLNAGGFDVPTYYPMVTISEGSVQAVSRSKYEALGLDLEKYYITWYVPNLDAIDLMRDVSGDMIETGGKRFQLVGGTDWLQVNGWKNMLAVYVEQA